MLRIVWHRYQTGTPINGFDAQIAAIYSDAVIDKLRSWSGWFRGVGTASYVGRTGSQIMPGAVIAAQHPEPAASPGVEPPPHVFRSRGAASQGRSAAHPLGCLVTGHLTGEGEHPPEEDPAEDAGYGRHHECVAHPDSGRKADGNYDQIRERRPHEHPEKDVVSQRGVGDTVDA